MVREIEHIFQVGALESVDALVVISHHEYIGLIPVRDEQAHQLILRAAGVLLFVNEYKLIFFLIAGEQILILFKGADHPVDHIVEIISVASPH